MKLTPEIANSLGLWIVCVPLLVLSIVQAFLIFRRAKSVADSGVVQLNSEEKNLALKTGLLTSIGPSITSFISIIGLQAVVGSPVALQRSAIICAAGTELRAANFAADAGGTVLGYGMPLEVYTAALWVMALNGCGWLLFCLIFTDKMTIATRKITGGSATMLTVFATSAILGTCCYNGTMYLKYGGGMITAFLCAVIMRSICALIAKKCKGILAWSMSLSLLAGMAGGAIFEYLNP